ncbi:unnamed protein product [Vicia faba]|uniref:Uncharacterized protein n=1 Tax=Vicia faba TaxID=3906 RepID=A0AAV1B6L8_VICFA|nr:unnamed protein product [Vicia faba]
MNPRSKPDSATVLSSYPDSGGLGCGYVMNRWGFAVGSVSMALGDGVADERSSPRGDDDSCVFTKAGGVEGCCGRHSFGGCRKCGGKVLKEFTSIKSFLHVVESECFGICLMITVLQLAQLPNIKVATVLLSSAFAYDIFWVFISPLIFHESVMIANPRVALQPPRMTGAMDVSESGREYGAKNTDDTPVTGTSQKTRGGAESRFRKRSKYLSYPYTNSEPRLKSFPAETEESNTPSPTPKAKASSRTKNSSAVVKCLAVQNSSVHLPVTYFQEQCINEDVEEDDINDEIQEDDINDKIQEDDLNDKIQEDDVDDEFQEDDIDLDDEFQEEDIDGEFQEDDVDEEFMEDDISNEFQEDDLDALLLEDKLE